MMAMIVPTDCYELIHVSYITMVELQHAYKCINSYLYTNGMQQASTSIQVSSDMAPI